MESAEEIDDRVFVVDHPDGRPGVLELHLRCGRGRSRCRNGSGEQCSDHPTLLSQGAGRGTWDEAGYEAGLEPRRRAASVPAARTGARVPHPVHQAPQPDTQAIMVTEVLRNVWRIQ